MLGETVCHVHRPGLALVGGVKTLREGVRYEGRGQREGERGETQETGPTEKVREDGKKETTNYLQ